MQPIPHCDGYYATNDGRIMSAKRWRLYELKPYKEATGYLRVSVVRDGIKMNQFIHRLVASAWLDNPDDLPCVNHKNGRKNDNSVDNLEWISAADNNQHAYDSLNKQAGKAWLGCFGSRHNTAKAVYQMTENYEPMKLFGSLIEAENETGVKRTDISACCHKKRKSAGGFHWQFVRT